MKKFIYLLLVLLAVHANVLAQPTPVASVTLTSTGPTTATATWPLSTDGSAGYYYVMISTDASFPGWSGGAGGYSPLTSWDFSGLTTGTTYYAYVSAVETGSWGWQLPTRSNPAVTTASFSASLSTVLVDFNTKSAGSYVSVTVTPKDSDGILLGSGKSVTVFLDGVSADYDGAIAVTDQGNGTYTASVRVVSTTVPNIISATVDGNAIDQTQTIAVLPSIAAATTSIITTNPTTITTDETSNILIQLKDQFGNILNSSGGTITLSTTVGAISGVVDHSDGTYSATLYTNTTGTSTINATLDGIALTDDAVVVFTEGAVSFSHSTIVATETVITADETTLITVQLSDQYGNNLSSSRGVVTLTTTLGVLTAVTDNNDGTYTASLSANSSGIGNALINGKLDGVALQDEEVVQIWVGIPSANTTTIIASPTTITADETSTITVQLKDQHGNLINATTSLVSLQTSLGVLSTVTDNEDGSFTATLAASTNGLGTATISGELNGSAIFDMAEVTITFGTANKLSLAIQPSNSAIAGVTFAQQPVVRIEDMFGNLVSTDNSTLVSVASTGSQALTGTLTATANNGLVAFSGLAYEVAETIKLQFTATGMGGILSDNVVVEATVASYFELNDPSSIIAGGTRAPYTVTRYDVYDNPVTTGSQTVYLYTSSLAMNAAFFETAVAGSPVSEIIIPDGSASANFWYYDEKAANCLITVSDVNHAPDGMIGIYDAADGLLVQPGALNEFQVNNINNPHTYGDIQNVTIIALDQFGNIKTDYTGTIRFESTDPSAQVPADYTFLPSDQGQVSFSNQVVFSHAGQFTLSVWDIVEPSSLGLMENIFVAQKPITIVANNRSKTYGEDLLLGTTDFSIIGSMVASEVITQIDLNSTGSAANANAGNYPIVPSNAIGSGGFIASNYDITYSSAGDLSVGQAILSVTANPALDKIYGDSDPTLPYTVSGFVADDDLSIITGALSRVNGEDAGTYDITQGTLSAGDNYIIDFTTNEFSILRRKLYLNAFVADNKTYDGTLDVRGAGFTDTRLPGDDLDFAFNANYTNKFVGTNKTVSINTIAINGGSDMNNYTLVTTAGSTTANIDARPLTLFGFSASNKVYDGTTAASGIGFIDDRVQGDQLNFSVTAAFADANVGNSKEVTYSAIDITGGVDRSNYYLVSNTGTAYANITAKGLVITANDVSKCDDGDPYGAGFSASYIGFVAGETASILTTPLDFTGSAINAIDPGYYTIVPTGAVAENYAITYQNGELKIKPSPTAIISGTANVCAGSPDPEITFLGTSGTAPFTFTYSINGGSYQSVSTIAGNMANLQQAVGTPGVFEYQLISVLDATGCFQDQSGIETITINPEVLAPTGPTAQSFCGDATLADVNITGSNLVWYDAEIGGNVLASFTLMADNANYYATQTINGCVSSERFKILVNINRPSAPTGLTTQVFCDAATVSDLVASGSDIIWYDAPVAGNPVPLSTLLTNGGHYYASQTIDGCESAYRTTFTATILESTTSTIEPVVCDNYTSPTGIIYTSSGTYVETIMNAAGCDSVITIILTVETCTGIENYTGNTISIYPNPATDNLILEGVGNAQIEILDVLGNTIFSLKSDQDKATLNIQSLSSGVYFVRINQYNQINLQKFVVKR